MTIKSSFNIFTSILIACVFFILLTLNYNLYISQLYAYMGLVDDFNSSRFFLSFIIIFLYIFFWGRGESTRAVFRNILFGVVLIPTLVIYSSGRGDENYLFIVLWAVAILCFFSNIKVPIIKAPNLSSKSFSNALLTCVALYILAIIAQGGLSSFNLNLTKVYEFRDVASERLHPIFDYISPVIGKVIIPFYVTLAAAKRRWWTVLLGILAGVLVFGFTSHKAPLIYPLVVLFGYYISKFSFSKLFYLGLASVVTLALLDFILSDLYNYPPIFGSLFARRALITSSQLNSFYIEFFSENPFLYWANSKFTLGLVEPPYNLNGPFIIGAEYFGSSEMSANTGWIGSGYANAGVIGVTLYSILIGILISYVASQAKRIGKGVVVGVSFVLFLIIFRSTDLATALLTHGILALIVFLTITPRER